ncbi:hypothetical protein Dimus_030165 [Dionaea muscipula]
MKRHDYLISLQVIGVLDFSNNQVLTVLTTVLAVAVLFHGHLTENSPASTSSRLSSALRVWLLLTARGSSSSVAVGAGLGLWMTVFSCGVLLCGVNDSEMRWKEELRD